MRETNLTPEQLAALPRTSRWRYEKRGWVEIKQGSKIDLSAFEAVPLEQMQNEVRIALRTLVHRHFPRWMTDEDLFQECTLALLRKSGFPEFQHPGWRVRVARNRLRDLLKRSREMPLDTNRA